MWKDYSMRYIKYNKSTSIFLGTISFISAALLSLLCGVFYNIWIDRVYRRSLTAGNHSAALEPVVIAYAFILITVCISLIAMIYNAFEVSMNSRLHQLGILQSIGAAPKQIRAFLLQEAFVLSLIPIIAGILSGIVLCYGFMRLIISVTDAVREYEVSFRYHIFIAITAFLLSVLTIIISAWIPAKRISRLTPLTAINYGGEPSFKKLKPFRLFSKIFGIYGELAKKSIYSRKKALKASTLSLSLSFLGFISFLNLETISGISTQHTYFERYRDKWDLMLTTTDMQDKEDYLLNKIRSIDDVKNCIAYKKVSSSTNLTADKLNRELSELGIDRLTENIIGDKEGNYLFNVPIYILDNQSFENYLIGNGLNTDTEAVALNMIWDSINSDRMNRTYIPLLNDNKVLKINIGDNIPITITAFTDTLPEIKEEFKQGSLSLVISENLYNVLAEYFTYSEIYYNIHLSKQDRDTAVQEKIKALMDENSKYVLESRLEKENSDTSMRNALKIVIGSLAALLSSIGIANVFSSTLGHIYQRRKEFARYLSIGLSPRGMRKILVAEALIISIHPILLSLLINIPIVALALNTASIPANEFIANAPILPTLAFALIILLFVGTAYYIGGKKICNDNIIDILKDETMI